MPPRKKTPYDDTFRFRAYSELAERMERIVVARGYGDASDLMREAVSSKIMEEEKRLGLEPMPQAKKQVNYRQSKRKK